MHAYTTHTECSTYYTGYIPLTYVMTDVNALVPITVFQN